jgi:pimeloyl-ACP methyl ester carboxylesterase
MKLFFKKSGEGRPLIILHGLFGMGDNWMTLSRKFIDNGFQVYGVDARNHGRSPHSDEFNYHVMSEDLIELMDDENISAATVIGHSMGGKTAMWLACKHPDRVSKLISVDISPKYYAPHHQTVFAAIHGIDLGQLTSRKAAETGLREILHDEDTIRFLLKNLYWDEKEKLAWRFYLSGIEKSIGSIGDALPEEYMYNGKTLFLRGEKSGYVTVRDESEIVKHFPKAVISTVSNAGHWIHAENPNGFMDVVLSFIK